MKLNILIIGNPHSHPSTQSFLLKFIRIIKETAGNVYLISGDNPQDSSVNWFQIRYKPQKRIIGRISNFLSTQLDILSYSLKVYKNIDAVIILPTSMFFPLILFKFFHRTTILFAAQKNENYFLKLFSRISFMFAHLIIIESQGVINDLKIGNYSNKIVKGNIYVDTSFFKYETPLSERQNVVGYIGLLTTRKGTGNLIEAISNLSRKSTKIEFLVGGIGTFADSVDYVSKNNHSVIFKGLIPQADMPKYFNQMKLFILPSLSEGVPNVILEAMACGTPVLATAVGGIPNVVINGKTGFILKNNTPKCIEDNIIAALESEKLEEIANNALKLIEDEYSYESAVNRYDRIFSRITSCEGKK